MITRHAYRRISTDTADGSMEREREEGGRDTETDSETEREGGRRSVLEMPGSRGAAAGGGGKRLRCMLYVSVI
jgi:hypothetical protein